VSKSNKLYDKAKTLAKNHNLKGFFNATLEKDSIFAWIKKNYKKVVVIGGAIAILIYVIFFLL